MLSRAPHLTGALPQGWHRPQGYQEVQTPNMNKLVKEGIELDHAYSYKFCSPTRSCLQSGRLVRSPPPLLRSVADRSAHPARIGSPST